jgi:hypothetical protein
MHLLLQKIRRFVNPRISQQSICVLFPEEEIFGWLIPDSKGPISIELRKRFEIPKP